MTLPLARYCLRVGANKTVYIQGETAAFTLADSGYSTVVFAYGSASVTMSLDDGVWTARISTSALSGFYNFAIIADGECVDAGSFSVRVLSSRYRAVVAAIDASMAKVGANGKASISVGEISLTDKTFDEMLKWRGYYESLANAEESGGAPNLGPWRTEVALA